MVWDGVGGVALRKPYAWVEPVGFAGVGEGPVKVYGLPGRGVDLYWVMSLLLQRIREVESTQERI